MVIIIHLSKHSDDLNLCSYAINESGNLGHEVSYSLEES